MTFRILVCNAESSDYSSVNNILYREVEDADSDTCIQSKCRLDIYSPTKKTAKYTLIFFHGGGLTSGEKFIPGKLQDQNINVVSADYRLSPNPKAPAYIEDCAAAVAWTYNHIQEYGGDPKKIYLSGESAGAYLATMLYLNKKYLGKYNIDPDSLAGLFSFSGQMTTHFTICNERGLNVGSDTQIVDQYAPLYYVRKTIKPLYFIIGDSALDMPGRAVQNKLIVKQLKLLGNDRVNFIEIKEFKHEAMITPALDSVIYYLQHVPASIVTPKIQNITISPNPVSQGFFKVYCDEEILNLSIFNEIGLLSKSISHISNTTVDVHELKKGTYFVQCKTKTRDFRQKMLIL